MLRPSSGVGRITLSQPWLTMQKGHSYTHIHTKRERKWKGIRDSIRDRKFIKKTNLFSYTTNSTKLDLLQKWFWVLFHFHFKTLSLYIYMYVCMYTYNRAKNSTKKWNTNDSYMALAFGQKSLLNICVCIKSAFWPKNNNVNHLPGIIDTVLRARSTRNVRKPAKLPTSIPEKSSNKIY